MPHLKVFENNNNPAYYLFRSRKLVEEEKSLPSLLGRFYLGQAPRIVSPLS